MLLYWDGLPPGRSFVRGYIAPGESIQTFNSANHKIAFRSSQGQEKQRSSMPSPAQQCPIRLHVRARRAVFTHAHATMSTSSVRPAGRIGSGVVAAITSSLATSSRAASSTWWRKGETSGT